MQGERAEVQVGILMGLRHLVVVARLQLDRGHSVDPVGRVAVPNDLLGTAVELRLCHRGGLVHGQHLAGQRDARKDI